MRLRPLAVADAAVIATWAGDPEFCRRAGWDGERSPADVRAHHERLITDPPPELLRLGAELGGELVGYVDLHGVGSDERELGLVVGGRERWGRGLGTAAATAAVAHALEVVGLDALIAHAAADNEPSQRVLRRLGFVTDSESPAGPCRLRLTR